MKKPFPTPCFKDFTNNIVHKGPIFFKAGYCGVILKHLKSYHKLFPGISQSTLFILSNEIVAEQVILS